MAQQAVPVRFAITLNDSDRGINQQLDLRTARHPSETLERVWLRVLAYCWQWQESLAFGAGLSTPDEPDLIAKDPTGQTIGWVAVGKPDPQRMQRAVDRNPQARVAVLFESPARLDAFLAAAADEGINRFERLEIAAVEPKFLTKLAGQDQRRFELNLVIVGDHFYVSLGDDNIDGPLVRGSVGAS